VLLAVWPKAAGRDAAADCPPAVRAGARLGPAAPSLAVARTRAPAPFPPDLVPAAFHDDSALRGSLALILDHLADELEAA